MVFLAYGAGDPNIQAILSDIDEALPETGGVIPNVFMVEWNPNLKAGDSPPRDRLIAVEAAKSVRIKSIITGDSDGCSKRSAHSTIIRKSAQRFFAPCWSGHTNWYGTTSPENSPG